MVTCSILVPAYNGEKYIRRALDSVLNQTYKDFEVVLIDDGSIDTTPQICDEYAKNYSYIHVYHQENIGVLKTRMKLLQKAGGKYIFWLDQDDYLAPTLLEKAMKTFQESNPDVVVWGRVQLMASGQRLVNHASELGAEKWRWMNLWGFYPAPIHFASKKELWESCYEFPKEWERFPDGLELAEDIWLTSQMMPFVKKVVSLEECLYYYERANMNSITRSYTSRKLYRDAFAFYNIVKINLVRYPNEFPPNLEYVRKLLLNTYCVNLIRPSLTDSQIINIKLAIKDMMNLFPQKKLRKFYFVQLCATHGIDFICRSYGKGRIKRYEG